MIAQHPIKYNPAGFGHRYGDTVKADGKVGLHPGADYNGGNTGNADLNMDVRPVFGGEVVYVGNAGSGWGNMIVVYSEVLKRWNRLAHLNKIYVKLGQVVGLDDVVGLVGKTGTSSPHCHCDIIKKLLAKWTNYTWGFSRSQLDSFYEDPLTFINEVNKRYEIPDWARESWKKAIGLGIAPSDPNKEIDAIQFQKILKEAGIIKEVGSLPAYRLIVILDKLQALL